MNRQDMSFEEKKVKLIVSVYIQSRSQVDLKKNQLFSSWFRYKDEILKKCHSNVKIFMKKMYVISYLVCIKKFCQ